MINVLFVDDDANILQAMRRLLHPLRRDWSCWYAQSGPEALAVLAEQPVDVIVTDMRMPWMDGAELLTEVRDRYPEIIRIILSGYSEKDSAMRSLTAAHQYLSKPCEPEVLQNTIERVFSLRGILNNDALRTFVAKIPNIPSLPHLYSALLDELGRPEPSTPKVAGIIRQDPGMTAKLLQIVNSAFFSLKRRVSDVKEAIDLLGLETIGALTFGLGIISQFEAAPGAEKRLGELWSHCLEVGARARKIARRYAPSAAADSFTAGLLHDVGEFLLAVNLPDEFDRVKKMKIEEEMTTMEAEQRVLGATHAEVGAYLLGLWGLPRQVVEAVAYHHEPERTGLEGFSAVTAVHIADALDNQKRAGRPPHFDAAYLSRLGLPATAESWIDAV
ncbi:MAG: HDOD domain-containing protein [Acidobacteria bacterium]|nr:HDOD domain-containing protein [Acidobacteriota bacterium]